MITFLAAVYNEEDEVGDLLRSVRPYVDAFSICDDGSTDRTLDRISKFMLEDESLNLFKQVWVLNHTGLPETVKNEALKHVQDRSWVLMLDADERVDFKTLVSIRRWVDNSDDNEASYTDYVYFRQLEEIDGVIVREFQKAKLFRKEAMRFPLDNIHADDILTGTGTYRPDWVVLHRKSSDKQRLREQEYLVTYKKLLDEGKIDVGRYQWLVSLHHYLVPHG